MAQPKLKPIEERDPYAALVVEAFDRLSGLHDTIAASHPSLARGQVWCRTCGATQTVDSSRCLREGWPLCCGETMTIDAPGRRTHGGGAMCTIVFRDGDDIYTVAELRRVWPTIIEAGTGVLARSDDEDYCLCSIDIEESAFVNGERAIREDHGDYYVEC